MVDEAQHRLPTLAPVTRVKEDARRTAEPERPVGARLDMPCLLERQLVILGQAEPFAALPRLAAVVRALDGRAVHGVIRGGEDRGVVLDGVEHVPSAQVRPFDFPVTPPLIALEDEEALAGAHQDPQRHRSLAYPRRWSSSRRS